MPSGVRHSVRGVRRRIPEVPFSDLAEAFAILVSDELTHEAEDALAEEAKNPPPKPDQRVPPAPQTPTPSLPVRFVRFEWVRADHGRRSDTPLAQPRRASADQHLGSTDSAGRRGQEGGGVASDGTFWTASRRPGDGSVRACE
jgi:hypothetical protein